MEISIAEWGNSLGLRIPKDIALETGLKKGTRVEIKAENGKVVIARAKPKPKLHRKYTIEELMANTTPEEYRKALDPAFYEWMQSSIGREVIKD